MSHGEESAAERSSSSRSAPSHHGDAAAEMAALRTAAGLADREGCGRFVLRGGRRASYLHRVTAQAIEGLGPPRAVRAALLERTGKLVDVLTVVALPDQLLVLTSAAHRERAGEWLAKFIFREDVQIEDRTDATGHVLLAGPRATEAAGLLAGPAAAALLPLSWIEVPGAPGTVLIRGGAWGEESFELVGPRPEVARLRDLALRKGSDAGVAAVGKAALEALRVLAGVPEGGAEIDETTNPLELGLHDTLALTKGCFTGQEAIAKMITHKAVRRKLVGVELGDAPLPPRGAVLRTATEVVGRVTSRAEVPDDGRHVALALVRLEQAAPATRLFCGEEEAAPEVTVSGLPFPETPR